MASDLGSILLFFEQAPLWWWAAVLGTLLVGSVLTKYGVGVKKTETEETPVESPSAETFAAAPPESDAPPPPASEPPPPSEPTTPLGPSMEAPHFNGDKDNLDKALEYYLFTGLVNSAKDAKVGLSGLKVKTRFGNLTMQEVETPPPSQPIARSDPLEKVAELPEANAGDDE